MFVREEELSHVRGYVGVPAEKGAPVGVRPVALTVEALAWSPTAELLPVRTCRDGPLHLAMVAEADWDLAAKYPCSSIVAEHVHY